MEIWKYSDKICNKRALLINVAVVSVIFCALFNTSVLTQITRDRPECVYWFLEWKCWYFRLSVWDALFRPQLWKHWPIATNLYVSVDAVVLTSLERWARLLSFKQVGRPVWRIYIYSHVSYYGDLRNTLWIYSRELKLEQESTRSMLDWGEWTWQAWILLGIKWVAFLSPQDQHLNILVFILRWIY